MTWMRPAHPGAALKIAQVAPLMESVPPRFYGGTERVVSYLTEELVRQGHEVSLFASGDSVTQAELRPMTPRALRLDPHCGDPLACYMLALAQVAKAAAAFDIVHFHFDYLHYALCRALRLPHITTLHGRLDLGGLPALYREYAEMPVVSISDHQRTALPHANWRATVYHGLPPELYHYHAEHRGYLAFLGRISPEKGIEQAVAIARSFGMPLRVAAKVDKGDRGYYEEKVKSLLCGAGVEYVGEISEREKDDFLGDAYAVLCPVNWPEPFGLVLIEAMACGTPVVAFRRGSIPEIVRDGETGFIVDDAAQAVAALSRVERLDRRRCRQVFEEHYTAARMATDYLAVYRNLSRARGAA
jgi:glycosyltransferase involved in cell wall biosynthesis